MADDTFDRIRLRWGWPPARRCTPVRTPHYPALEHRRVPGVALRPCHDLDASARSEAEASQSLRIQVLTVYPRVRQRAEKIHVAPRLKLDPIDERCPMMVDQMGKRAAAEQWEVGAGQHADDVSCQVEGLRWRQGSEDLTNPSPGQIRLRRRLAQVARVAFGESTELNRRSHTHDVRVSGRLRNATSLARSPEGSRSTRTILRPERVSDSFRARQESPVLSPGGQGLIL